MEGIVYDAYYEVPNMATIYVAAARGADAFRVEFTLPSIGSWFGKNWYVALVIAIFLVACAASMVVSLIRWNMRMKHRELREEKQKKDVMGGLRRVASTMSMRSSAAHSQAGKHDNDDDSHYV